MVVNVRPMYAVYIHILCAVGGVIMSYRGSCRLRPGQLEHGNGKEATQMGIIHYRRCLRH